MLTLLLFCLPFVCVGVLLVLCRSTSFCPPHPPSLPGFLLRPSFLPPLSSLVTALHAWLVRARQVDALAPYMFHIVIENTPRECYFTVL